jgi:hypothetical protein
MMKRIFGRSAAETNEQKPTKGMRRRKLRKMGKLCRAGMSRVSTGGRGIVGRAEGD